MSGPGFCGTSRVSSHTSRRPGRGQMAEPPLSRGLGSRSCSWRPPPLSRCGLPAGAYWKHSTLVVFSVCVYLFLLRVLYKALRWEAPPPGKISRSTDHYEGETVLCQALLRPSTLLRQLCRVPMPGKTRQARPAGPSRPRQEQDFL